MSEKSSIIDDYDLETRTGNTTSVHTAAGRDKILSLCKSDQLDSQGKLTNKLWKALEENLVHEEVNAQSWWRKTGLLLAVLLQKTDYQLTAQYDILHFYFYFLTPRLGPRPDSRGQKTQWKSFMTDDGTPIEMSWEWGLGDRSPTVRLSIEPIGFRAGTSHDPLNQFATYQLVEEVQQLSPYTDLRWFHHFSRELLTYRHAINSKIATSAIESHKSRSFVAFDFGETEPMLKVYFIPTFKAREDGQSTLLLISEAIAKLTRLEGTQFPAFDFLLSNLRTYHEGSQLIAEMFSVDCTSPACSRMKVYLRSQSTSFASVRANMTLNGGLKQRNLDKGIVELEKLWRLVLLPAQHSSQNQELPHNTHRTAGILYYYDFRPGQLYPTPRVYIPVRHYGQDDMAIAEGLASYLKSRGQELMATQYVEALQKAYPRNSLRKECGAQTYIGCTIVDGNLRITSYLKPRL